jgi:hypothetical protein
LSSITEWVVIYWTPQGWSSDQKRHESRFKTQPEAMKFAMRIPDSAKVFIDEVFIGSEVRAPRFCRQCNNRVDWIKDKPTGAHRAVFRCRECGGPTRRIKGLRKSTYMPKGLYGYRQKVKVANDLWRHLIYRKAVDGRCAVCSGAKGLQAMHLYPKGRYPHLRFDLKNGAPGCPGCHRRLTNDHEAHRDFCIRYLGADEYELLRLRSISRAKLDIDLTIMCLKRETDEGKANNG